MLQGADGPVGQAEQLLGNGLDPDLHQGEPGGLVADSDLVGVAPAHVGLVEHVRIRVKTEKVASIDSPGIVEQVGEGAGATRSGDPFIGGAGLRVAVVVDGCCPARDDGQTSVAVAGDGCRESIEGVRVAQHGAGVVTDHELDAVVHPCLDSITVVQTSDGGRDETVCRELVASGDANLLHPRDVEVNLAARIVVGSIVELLVREGVRYGSENVLVVLEPGGDGVQLGAGQAPGVVLKLGGPQVGSGAQGLLELERRVRGGVVVNSVGRRAQSRATGMAGGIVNIAVTVVANLNKVVGAWCQTRVDVGLPSLVGVKIPGADAEVGVVGVV